MFMKNICEECILFNKIIVKCNGVNKLMEDLYDKIT